MTKIRYLIDLGKHITKSTFTLTYIYLFWAQYHERFVIFCLEIFTSESMAKLCL
jgi:hypothetical protein